MNMRMPILVGGLLLAATSFAQGDENAKSFSMLDSDGDLRISPQEAREDAAVLAQFAALDENQDGYIDAAEFQALDRADERY